MCHVTSHLPLFLYARKCCCIITTLLNLFSVLQHTFPFVTVFFTPAILSPSLIKALLSFLPSSHLLSFPFPCFLLSGLIKNCGTMRTRHYLHVWCDREGEREFWRTCFALYMFPLLLPSIIHRLSLEFISIWTVISSGELERDGWSRERSRQNERERHRQTVRERQVQTPLQRTLGAERRSGED